MELIIGGLPLHHINFAKSFFFSARFPLGAVQILYRVCVSCSANNLRPWTNHIHLACANANLNGWNGQQDVNAVKTKVLPSSFELKQTSMTFVGWLDHK